MTDDSADGPPVDPLGFDDGHAADLLPRLGADEIDLLTFGVIGFDAADVVVVYNAYESRRAGIPRERVLGRNVFAEVAPCTDNFMVAQRYHDAPDLDEQLDYVFTLRMRPTPVRLRLLAQRGADLRYMLIRPT